MGKENLIFGFEMTGIVLILTVIMLIVFFAIGNCLFSRGVVRLHDFYMIKKKEEEGIIYFTLHTRSNKFPFSPYKAVGESYVDPVFGLPSFILYKFNTVEEAEEYFDNNF
jgi:hypothetical protein